MATRSEKMGLAREYAQAREEGSFTTRWPSGTIDVTSALIGRVNGQPAAILRRVTKYPDGTSGREYINVATGRSLRKKPKTS